MGRQNWGGSEGWRRDETIVRKLWQGRREYKRIKGTPIPSNIGKRSSKRRRRNRYLWRLWGIIVHGFQGILWAWYIQSDPGWVRLMYAREWRVKRTSNHWSDMHGWSLDNRSVCPYNLCVHTIAPWYSWERHMILSQAHGIIFRA